MFAWHVQFPLDSLLECLVSVVWKWSLSDADVAEVNEYWESCEWGRGKIQLLWAFLDLSFQLNVTL